MNTYYAKQYKEIRKMQKPVKKLTILSDCDDLSALLETLNQYKTSNLTTREKETWAKLIKIVEKKANGTKNKEELKIERNKFKIEQENYRAALKEQRLNEKLEMKNLKIAEKEEKIKMKELESKESDSQEKKAKAKQEVPVVAKSNSKITTKNKKSTKSVSKKK